MVLGVLCLVFIGVCYFAYNNLFFVVNPRDYYYLSEDQLNDLKRTAIIKKDGDAAFRVSQYYSRYKKDTNSTILWLQKASDLGNKSAQEIYGRLKPYLDDAEPSATPK